MAKIVAAKRLANWGLGKGSTRNMREAQRQPTPVRRRWRKAGKLARKQRAALPPLEGEGRGHMLDAEPETHDAAAEDDEAHAIRVLEAFSTQLGEVMMRGGGRPETAEW